MTQHSFSTISCPLPWSTMPPMPSQGVGHPHRRPSTPLPPHSSPRASQPPPSRWRWPRRWISRRWSRSGFMERWKIPPYFFWACGWRHGIPPSTPPFGLKVAFHGPFKALVPAVQTALAAGDAAVVAGIVGAVLHDWASTPSTAQFNHIVSAACLTTMFPICAHRFWASPPTFHPSNFHPNV